MDHVIEVPEINTFVRLPVYMREANRGLFEPRVVAIGPYHHGINSTRDMEAHKERFRYGFFQRLGGDANRPQITAQCTQGALRCYSGNVGVYTAEDVMRDGCFIVELLLQWNERKEIHVDNHMRLMSNSIYYDLLLVDNQIPFFVLDRIFDELKSRNDHDFNNTKLIDLFIIFFNHKGQFAWTNPGLLGPPSSVQVRHLLDLQYNLVISNMETTRPTRNSCPFILCGNICHKKPPMPRGIPGANELQDYGVKFRVNKNEKCKMFDVTFVRKTMKIPFFEMNFGSKILLANLFAYDQIACQIGGQPTRNNVGFVTSYVVLMNALINTKKDVVVLQREGILDNLLSNEEEVATFFNKLGSCALVDVREHRYTSMFKDVNKYWMNRFNCCKYLAIFGMKHFRNPWAFLSLVGAILFFKLFMYFHDLCHSQVYTWLELPPQTNFIPPGQDACESASAT